MTKEERFQKYLAEHPTYAEKFFTLREKAEAKFSFRVHEKARRQIEVIERADAMLEDYKNSLSLEEVAEHWNVTRERVRQILTKYHADVYETLKKANAERRHEERLLKEYVCKECGNKFWSDKHATFCSVAHRIDYRKRSGVPYPDWVGTRGICPKNFTKEEWRIINNIRTKYYYHKNNEARRAYNRKYMNTPERKKLQAIYTMRVNERKLYGHAITPIPNPKRPEVTKP